MEKIKILIADDHALVRQMWASLFNMQNNYEVIAECGTGEEAVESTERLRPDVVIMDINLPGINGLEATRQIHALSPSSKILGVSLHNQPAYARKMMQEGAAGYVTKNSTREEMMAAVQAVSEGRRYVCEEIKNALSEEILLGAEKKGVQSLSPKERLIVAALKTGASSKEIADSMHISAKTVEVHRYNILKKLGLPNTAALINFISQHPDLDW